MPKKYITILLFFLAAAEITNAQKKFVPGYIIASGDTLKGFMHLKEGAQTYQFCDFKRYNDGEEKRYTPETLDGYGYENDRAYISASLEKEGGLQKVFLEVYITGNISVYRLEDDFVLQKDNKFYTLKNTTERVTVDGEKYVKDKKEYLGIISYLTNDCEGFKPPIPLNRISYSIEGIGSYIQAYNKCVGVQETSILTQKPFISLSFGVGLSASLQKFFIGDEYNHPIGDELKTNMDLGVGFPLHLYFPRLSNRYSFYIEPQFIKTSINHFNSVNTGGARNEFFINTNFNLLKIPFGFKYRHTTRLINPNIGAGAALNSVSNINQDWSRDIYYTFIDVTQSQTLTPLPLLEKYFGFWGSVGAESKLTKNLIIFVNFHMEYGNGVFNLLANDTKSRLTNSKIYQISIGIKTR